MIKHFFNNVFLTKYLPKSMEILIYGKRNRLRNRYESDFIEIPDNHVDIYASQRIKKYKDISL
jgi:hypothetical protein